MHTTSFDFLVVGAGIVGLTVASELRRHHPAARIAVLEKEMRPGMHASGRNSGVLHSGIYYASDTLKAQVCAKGAERMRAFAAEHGIPCERSGKVILATQESDLPTLDRLLCNAKDNGIRVERLDEQSLREIEPHAAPGPAAIYSPDTAVIDSGAMVERLRVLLEQQGIQFFWGCTVRAASPEHFTVETNLGQVTYGYLFNCAGANADVLARGFGLARDYALIPFKGIYWKLGPKANRLVRANIYPVPDISLPFLGVHLTRVIHGDVYVGPTAIPALGRENYGLFQGLRVREAIDIGWWLATLYLENHKNFRALVHTELRKYRKANFLTAARRLVPALDAEDLVPTSKAGIRPQLVNLRERRLEMDYILERTETSMHVLNAISPAFTSSFAFAELIVERSGTC